MKMRGIGGGRWYGLRESLDKSDSACMSCHVMLYHQSYLQQCTRLLTLAYFASIPRLISIAHCLLPTVLLLTASAYCLLPPAHWDCTSRKAS